MKATREDFNKFLEQCKNTITDTKIDTTQVLDFKDYAEYENELKEFLAKNSKENWTTTINFTGIAITRN